MLKSGPTPVLHTLPCSVSVCLPTLQNCDQKSLSLLGSYSDLSFVEPQPPLVPAMLPCIGSGYHLPL